MKIFPLFACSLFLLITSCAVQEKAEIKSSEILFDQDSLHTYNIIIADSLMKKLDNDPAAEEYVDAMLAFKGDTIPVGLRYKGSIGSFVGCLSEQDWRNPNGFKTCPKISMKVKVNWDNVDTTFYGLKKLQFHSMNHDDSQFRDRLGYSLFSDMGVVAPRSVHARLVINGVNQGLYAFIEQIDDVFIQKNFQEGRGDLYKDIWPLSSDGRARTEEAFLSRLESDTAAMKIGLMKTFAKEMSDSLLNQDNTLTKYLDISTMLSYVAVDRSIANDDGAFHWYCGKERCGPHNFFWYEDAANGKCVLIPWDLDNAFFDDNPVTPVSDDFGEVTSNCQPFAFGKMGLKQMSASCDPIIGGLAKYESLYVEQLQKLIEGPYSKMAVDQKLDTWAAQIEAATREAAIATADNLQIEDWNVAIQTLKDSIDLERGRIRERISRSL